MTPMTPDVPAICASLTKAQRDLICALDDSWKYPRQIIPNGTASQLAWRDERLVERMSPAAGNPYRLTPLGLAVRAHLLKEQQP